jgi:hypothetical protein
MAKEFIKRIKNSDFLKPLEKQAAISLAEGSMLSSKFLSRESFLSQAALLNSEIWKSLFTSSPRPLIELELEKLTIDCLASDLALSDSPLARALTEPDIVKSLLPALAGVRGAWSASLLGQLAPPNAPMWRSTGTVFFWGVKNGRFFPMRIELVKNSIYLSGAGFNIPLAPEPLVTALSEGHLAPNLFVDYLVLAVHGLTAHGGVFMIDYLPALLEPAAHILEIKLETAPPLLAAGLLPLSAPDEPLSPLGLLEWLSFGPRPPELARLLGDTTIESLTPFSLGEWYQEEFPTSRRASSWRGPVAPPPLTLSSNKT